MLDAIRAMPGGIRLFLVYAFRILAGIGLSLRYVVDQAIEASISFEGVVVMALLALSRLPVEAVFTAVLGVLLFRGLLRPEIRTYLNEP